MQDQGADSGEVAAVRPSGVWGGITGPLFPRCSLWLICESVLAPGALLMAMLPTVAWGQADPLPSWNNGAAKAAIIEFVEATTATDSPDFVPVAERIATFDNDGTLWVEQPMYTQLVYILAQVPALVALR